jgi:hypothetical protein
MSLGSLLQKIVAIQEKINSCLVISIQKIIIKKLALEAQNNQKLKIELSSNF